MNEVTAAACATYIQYTTHRLVLSVETVISPKKEELNSHCCEESVLRCAARPHL